MGRLFRGHDLLYNSIMDKCSKKVKKFYYNPISGLIEPIPFDGHKMPGYNYSKVIENVYNKRTVYDRVFLPNKWFVNFSSLNKMNSMMYFLRVFEKLRKNNK